jgi:hypothetical protein
MLSYNGVPLPLDMGFGITPPHLFLGYGRQFMRELVDELPPEDALIPTELARWLQQNFRLDDLRPTLPPRPWPGARQARLEGTQWSDPISFRLNTLVWPAHGATRFSWFHCFVTDDILSQLPGCDFQPYDLVMDSDDDSESEDNYLSASMYMLDAKPITIPGDNKLYLMTLVDKRFFLRTVDAGNFQVKRKFDLPYSTTWQDLIDQIGTSLGLETIGIPTEIEEEYGFPHPLLTSRFDNAAVLLDAVATSLGRRLVAALDGSFALETVEDSELTFADNIDLPATETVRAGFWFESEEEEPEEGEEEDPEEEQEDADEDEEQEEDDDDSQDEDDGGGDGDKEDHSPPQEGIHALEADEGGGDEEGDEDGDESEEETPPEDECFRLPYTVRIVFQKSDVRSPADEVYAIEQPASDFYPDADTTNYAVTIHTTATAYFNCVGDILNEDAVNALAEKIAGAYYGAFASRDDAAFACIVPFEPEGLTDTYVWTYSKDDISTRVVNQPVLDGAPTEQFHSLGPDPAPESFWARIVGYMPPASGSGSATETSFPQKGNRFQFVEVTPQSGGAFALTQNGIVTCPESETEPPPPSPSPSPSIFRPLDDTTPPPVFGYAYEVNGSKSDLTGQIVRMWRSPPIDGEYLFQSEKTKARWVRGTLYAAKTASSAPTTIVVTEFWDGTDPCTTDDHHLAVQDEDAIFSGSTGAACRACYKPESDEYSFVWVHCTSGS